MFRNLSSSLRSDIYTVMEHVKTWLTGELGCARAGDGMSYSEHMNIIQKHFPDAKMEFNSIGNTDAEVSKVVSGITNMILELSKWDGVMSGVAMKTWVNVLEKAYIMAAAADEGRTTLIRKGISEGVELTDVALMTKEFAVRLELVSLLKNVNTKLYGAGSVEAQRGDALWNSRFI